MPPRRSYSPEQRAQLKRELEGIIHANRRIANPDYDPHAATRQARLGERERRLRALEAEIDPGGRLAAATRRTKAMALDAAQKAENRLARLEARAPRKLSYAPLKLAGGAD